MFRQCAAALLLVLACTSAAQAEEACVDRHVLSVPSRREGNGHVFVPVTLGTQKSYFAIDTGGSWSMMDQRLAQSLNIQIRDLPPELLYTDAVGGQITHYITVPGVKIGEMAVNAPFDFLVIAPFGGDVAYDGGVLGLNLLALYDMEIDPLQKTVSFYVPSELRGCGDFWANHAGSFHIFFDKQRGKVPIGVVKVNGQDTHAVIDTGAYKTVIDIDYAERHLGITTSSPGVVKSADKVILPSGASTAFYETTVDSISIGGVEFKHVPVQLADLSGMHMLLGIPELGRLRLYFAFHAGVVYAAPADAK